MSNLREAAQQALEALENCSSDYGHRCNRCDSEVDEGGKVASALRAALAQPAAPTPYTEADCLAAEKKWSAPAAPTVVEPVAWASPSVIPLREGQNNHPCVLTDTRCAANTVPLYATPPRAVQKPSESLEALRVMLQEAVDRLIATPPRAPLSDEQIDDCLPLGMAPHSTLVGPDEIRKFARAVIAASGGPRNE